MSRMQRSKGCRIERGLVNFFKAKNMSAVRVPLSGAASGFKGDVIVKYGAERYEIEVKGRAKAFASIYKAVDEANGTLRIKCSDTQKLYLASYEFKEVTHTAGFYKEATKETKGVIKRLNTFFKWLGTADILVLKDDRKPYLFIKYL